MRQVLRRVVKEWSNCSILVKGDAPSACASWRGGGVPAAAAAAARRRHVLETWTSGAPPAGSGPSPASPPGPPRMTPPRGRPSWLLGSARVRLAGCASRCLTLRERHMPSSLLPPPCHLPHTVCAVCPTPPEVHARVFRACARARVCHPLRRTPARITPRLDRPAIRGSGRAARGGLRAQAPAGLLVMWRCVRAESADARGGDNSCGAVRLKPWPSATICRTLSFCCFRKALPNFIHIVLFLSAHRCRDSDIIQNQ